MLGNDSIWNIYKKIEVIGRGTYGKVYKAQCRNTERFVAIKKTKHDSDGTPATTLREIAILKRIKSHDHVVKLEAVKHHFSKNGGPKSILMIMEFVECDLYKYMIDYGRMDNEIIKGFLCQILVGVNYCHELRICHRDLKPSNILVDLQTGCIKIADFGLSRTMSFPLAPYSPETVTQLYRAPEIFYGAKTYGYSVDLWSVGCIFAEMVRSRPLFYVQESSTFAIVKEIQRKLGDPKPEDVCYEKSIDMLEVRKDPEAELSTYVPGLNPQGVHLLSQMLLYNPVKRIYASEALKHEYFKI